MKKLDLTNQRFGRLVAMYEGPKHNNRTTWHCKCDCGNEKNILTSQLTSGRTQSCGCLQRERTRLANQNKTIQSGQKFNLLTVLNREENGSKWICQCDCGNIIRVSTQKLLSNSTQSCGCYQKKRASEIHFKSLVGQRYGKLTVLNLNIQKSNTQIKFYDCLCDCGNIVTVRASNLISNSTQSCGCLRISHGELKIKMILEQYNIPYTMEQSFETCINPLTRKKLRYDFYVNNQYLIEYHGKQHYETGAGWDEPLENIQFRDNFKIQWAKDNHIPLIVIPYTKYNELTIDDLLIN